MNHERHIYKRSCRSCGESRLKTAGIYLLVNLCLALFYPQIGLFAESLPAPSEQYVLSRARRAITEKNYAEAQKIAKNFISQKNGDAGYAIFFTMGNALALDGRKDEALSYYRQAIDRNGTDADLWFNMGKVAYDLQKFDLAGESFLKAYDLTNEKKPDLLYQVAICLIKNKKPDRALPYLEEICATATGKTRDDWQEALVDAYLKLKKNKEAAAVLQQLLAKEKDRPRSLKLMTDIYIENRCYNEAAAAYKLYIELTKATREEMIRLGDLYYLAGAPLKAARQYEQVPAGSASAGDYERIATAYLSAHREAKAAEILKQALVNHPSSRLWHMLGSIYYNLEEYPEAYDAFQQCFHMTPKDGSAALYMGYCALKINKTNDARKAFESAARFDRQHEAACKALAKIGYSADR